MIDERRVSQCVWTHARTFFMLQIMRERVNALQKSNDTAGMHRRFDYWSRITRIPPDIILEFGDKPWSWDRVSSPLYLDLRSALQAPNLPWNWALVSLHPHVTQEMVDSRPDEKWDPCVLLVRGLRPPANAKYRSKGEVPLDEWIRISRYGLADPKILTANIDAPGWDFVELSTNRDIVPVALNHRNKHWCTRTMGIYATLADVVNGGDFVGADHIGMMSMGDALIWRVRAAVTIQTAYRRWHAVRDVAAKRIACAFQRSSLNPAYRVCRKRLRRDGERWGMMGPGRESVSAS